MKHRLILIDDDKCAVDGVILFLETNGFVVDYAPAGDHGVALVRQNPGRYSLAIVDFFMPGMNGTATIREIRKIDPQMCVMGLSGDKSVDTHNTSLEAGAESFFVKGDSLEKLYGIVRRFCDKFEEANRVIAVETTIDEKISLIQSVGLVGRSTHLAQTATLIKKFGKTDETVLLRGENGTGKEKAARAIHAHSKRANKSFVAVNMTAITDTLFESQLFGHEKGAFTGASRSRPGLFQQANNGTLFLDEIGDLPMDMQVKLLRVLQEREITPVGAEKSIKVDVRIVAATNVDLEAAVKSGRFREDLYYRLKVFPIHLLPLRDRKEDIAPLVCHFTEIYNRTHGTEKGFLAKTVELLCNYDWRGNIRELENEIKKVLTLTETKTVASKDLDHRFRLQKLEIQVDEYPDLENELHEAERAFLRRKLAQANSIREAAEKMKISKTTLLRRMKALHIVFSKETGSSLKGEL